MIFLKKKKSYQSNCKTLFKKDSKTRAGGASSPACSSVLQFPEPTWNDGETPVASVAGDWILFSDLTQTLL